MKIVLLALLATFHIASSRNHDGTQVYDALPYDHSYTLGCVGKPEAPQYAGGIIINPELNEDLKGWSAAGNAQVANAQSPDGNNFVVVSNIRTTLSDGISQTFYLEKNYLYTVSAWFQVREGEAPIQAKFVADTHNETAAWIIAKSGCWTMLKGGFSTNVSQLAELHFESNYTGVEIWMDNISLQPFTQEEWTSHQDQSVQKVRKTRVKFEAVDANGKGVANAAVSIKQRQPHFPFGCAMNELIIKNRAYQKWFLEKGFRYTSFENELKWSATEERQGVENYTVPDAMLEFCKSNDILVRGHNILWDDSKFQKKWVNDLARDGRKLKAAAMKRVNSVVKRYRGQFIHWDVINENMHHNLFSNVTRNGSQVFKLVHHLDPHPILFLNEFNVIEGCGIGGPAQPWRYLQKIDELRSLGYDGPLGIGLESHFKMYVPNFPYIRASLDLFAATGLPIWITEFDLEYKNSPKQLEYVEPILRELHSHPAVDGIILWSSLGPNLACYAMCLTDNDYKNVPPGDLVDDFMRNFINVADTHGMTDANGVYEALLFYGEYEATITDLHDGATTSILFNLVPGAGDGTLLLHFKI